MRGFMSPNARAASLPPHDAGAPPRLSTTDGGRSRGDDRSMPNHLLLVLLLPLYIVLALLGGAEAVLTVLGAVATFGLLVGAALRVWRRRRRRTP